jgi:arsenate reductase
MYGIKNCQTMKKAMDFLDSNNITFEFHDYKKQGIDQSTLNEWLKQKPWDDLINRRGTTWRKLSDDDKTDIDNTKAIQLMIANPSLIKRPALLVDGQLYLGFDEAFYQSIF